MARHLIPLYAGVDIGGTRSKFGLVDANGHVLTDRIQPTSGATADGFLAALQSALDDCLRRSERTAADLRGIGIGVPGFTHAGRVESTWGFLPFMEDYPLTAEVEQRIGCPCFIDNDARAVGLAEARFGAGRACDRVVTLTLGTGIGFAHTRQACLVDDDPRCHMAGHIPIRDFDATCYCGLNGCLEQLCSATALHQRAHAAGLPDAEAVIAAATPAAATLLTTYLRDLARGLDTYCAVLAPELIILAGGLGCSLAPHLPQLSTFLTSRPFAAYRCRLAVGALHEQAGIVGAALLAHLHQQGAP